MTYRHCTFLRDVGTGTHILKLFWDQGITPKILPCISSLSRCPSENKQESWIENGARTFINSLHFAELKARSLAVASFAVHAGRHSSTKISVKQRCDREIHRLQHLSLSYNGFSQREKCVCERAEAMAVQWCTADSFSIWLWGVSTLRTSVISAYGSWLIGLILSWCGYFHMWLGGI